MVSMAIVLRQRVAEAGAQLDLLVLASERLKVHASMTGLAQAARGAEKQTVEGTHAEPSPERHLKQ